MPRRPGLSLAPVAFVALAARLSAQPLGGEFRVNSNTTDYQLFPQAAADGTGNFVVVWQGYGTSEDLTGVFGQRYFSSGAPAGGEFHVNTRTTNNQDSPVVGMSPSGDFVVVFTDRFGVAMQGISGQRYASAGNPLGGEFRVSTYTSLSQSGPRLALDSQGGFVVVWDASSQRILGRLFDSAGSPVGGEFQVNAVTTAPASSAAVARHSSGTFVVVWESYFGAYPNSYFHILGRRYASTGVPLDVPFRINTYTSSAKTFPSVAVDAAGNFVVAWSSRNQNGDVEAVFGQRYASAGNPLGGEFRVASSTAYVQMLPAVAVEKAGGFVVAWKQILDDDDVFAREFAKDGSPLGGAFRVNTYTSGYQGEQAIAVDGTGRFVVTWASNGVDGSFTSIQAQRLCPPLSAATISVTGFTTVCPTGTGGTATVLDSFGGFTTHQWQYRPTGGMSYTSIPGATGASYTITGTHFAGGTLGTYDLVCVSTPQCGVPITSSPVTITIANDSTGPSVSPPAAGTITQTLCQ